MKLKVTKIPTSLRRAAWTRPAKGQDEDGVVQFGAGSASSGPKKTIIVVILD